MTSPAVNSEGESASYEQLAQDYHWLFSDEVFSGQPFLDRHAHVLDALPPGAKVLDCACGIGTDAITLARQGYRVWGSDGSAAMAAEAVERGRAAGVDVPFVERVWDDLDQYDQRFDAIFCTGNAIVHAAGDEAMTRALRAMRSVLADDGVLVLATRDWEALHAERARIMLAERPLVRDGVTCTNLYIWTVPEAFEAPHTAELTFVLDDGGPLTHHRYDLTFHPFRRAELLGRLEAVGFTDLEVHQQGPGWYDVVARNAPGTPTRSAER